jgi:hypothetical protein
MLFYILQEGPAQTSGYMIAGYAVIFGVMLIYLVSLVVRFRNLNQDLEVLDELEEPEQWIGEQEQGVRN